MAVTSLHLPVPVSMFPFLRVSSLPGVYLQHNRWRFNDASGLSIQSESDPLHLRELSRKQRPTSYSYSACNVNWHPRRSSLSTALPGQRCEQKLRRRSLTLSLDRSLCVCVCSVFTSANSRLFSKSLCEAALMIAADDRFWCIVGKRLRKISRLLE